MIREFTINDLEAVDSIGSLISENFCKKNNIEERYKLEYVKIFVYEENNKILGFIEIETHFETMEIINIAVNEEYQNRNIASSLLNYCLKNITCERIILEVKETNDKAINFYKKNYFHEINRRTKYYGNEDAIILEREV